jgi:hypothetical protein
MANIDFPLTSLQKIARADPGKADAVTVRGNYPFDIGNTMCCDSPVAIDDSVEAGAPVREIEITPEAIELANAFYEALRRSVPVKNMS